MHILNDERVRLLNDDSGRTKQRMHIALRDALEPTEYAVAVYRVGAHIWVEAVVTDRALLIVRGAFRPKVTRLPFPITATRPPNGFDVQIMTPLGKKTLWGSRHDPRGEALRAITTPASSQLAPPATSEGQPPQADQDSLSSPHSQALAATSKHQQASPPRTSWLQARRAAGHRPRKPRLARVQMQVIGREPPPMMWDLADNCVICGRPLTNLDSQIARVGTTCIKRYGSYAREIPNPDHTAWLDEKAKAELDFLQKKILAEDDFTLAIEKYEAAKTEWLQMRTDGRSATISPAWMRLKFATARMLAMGLALGGQLDRVQSSRGSDIRVDPHAARVHNNLNGSSGLSAGVSPATYSQQIPGSRSRWGGGSGRHSLGFTAGDFPILQILLALFAALMTWSLLIHPIILPWADALGATHSRDASTALEFYQYDNNFMPVANGSHYSATTNGSVWTKVKESDNGQATVTIKSNVKTVLKNPSGITDPRLLPQLMLEVPFEVCRQASNSTLTWNRMVPVGKNCLMVIYETPPGANSESHTTYSRDQHDAYVVQMPSRGAAEELSARIGGGTLIWGMPNTTLGGTAKDCPLYSLEWASGDPAFLSPCFS